MIREALKKGFKVTKNSWLLFLVLFVYTTITGIYSTLFFSNSLQQNGNMSSISALTVVILVILFCIGGCYIPAGILGYLRKKNTLEEATISTFFFSGLKYFFSLLRLNLTLLALGFALIVGVAVSVVLIIAFVNLLIDFFTKPVSYAEAYHAGTLIAYIAVIVIGTITLLIGFCVALFMMYGSTIIVVNDSKILPAIKKSYSLIRQYQREALGLSGLILLTILIQIAISYISNHSMPGAPTQIGLVIFSGFSSTFFGIYNAAVILNFYFQTQNKMTEQTVLTKPCICQSSEDEKISISQNSE